MVDDLSPESAIVQAYQNLNLAAALRDPKVRARSIKQVNEVRQAVEEAPVRKLAADRTAAIDAIRARSATVEKTITDAIANKAPIKFGDFVNGLKDLLKDEAGKVPLMRLADFEMGPEDAQRFYQQAQDIAMLATPKERNAARLALRNELDAFRKDAVKAENVTRRAQNAVDALRQPPTPTTPVYERGTGPQEVGARLGAQQLKETTAERLARESAITYLSDPQARAAKELVAKEMEQQLVQMAKARVKLAEVGLPRETSEAIISQARALRDMPETEQYWAGKSLAGDIQRLVSPDKWDQVISVLNLPRRMKAGFDLSYPLRQGIILGAGHPKIFAETVKAMHAAAMSEDVAKAIETDILFGQFGKVRQVEGFGPDFVDRFGPLNQREEFAMGSLPGVNKLPAVIKKPLQAIGKVGNASERAYVVAGNKQRADVWDSVVRGWLPDELKQARFTSPEQLMRATGKTAQDFERLSTFINAATGRGKIGKALSSNNAVLNALFFAPKFFASRLEVPVLGAKYFVQNPALRKEIARSVVGYAVEGSTALYALSKVPGVTVELDPRSADYGDVRVGPLRFNYWAGFSPLVTAAARIGIGAVNAVTLLPGKHRQGDGRPLEVQTRPWRGPGVGCGAGARSGGQPAPVYVAGAHPHGDRPPAFEPRGRGAGVARGGPGLGCGLRTAGLLRGLGGGLQQYDGRQEQRRAADIRSELPRPLAPRAGAD